MTGAGVTVPVIDAQACVHALAPAASCRACVEACPHGALVLDEVSLGLDAKACTGCARCVPACPRGAIAAERPVLVLRSGPRRGEAFAACIRAGVADPPAMVCVHALGVRALDALAADGITRLTVATGPCETCPEGAGARDLSSAAADHRMIRHSRGEAAVGVTALTGSAFRRALAHAREAEDRVNLARRRLFAPAIIGPAVGDGDGKAAMPRAYVTPTVDAGCCTACGACIRLCPDGALAEEQANPARYVVTPDRCSGCGLCVDVCADAAIQLVPFGPAGVVGIPLDGFRCRACGVPVHVPAGRPPTDLCRICARTGQHRSLFQVLDP